MLFVLTKSPQQSRVHIYYFINFQTNGAKVIEFEMIFVIKKINLNYYYYYYFLTIEFFPFGELYVLETCKDLFEKLYLL